MPINTLEYTTLMQPALDQQVIAQATSGWMEANAGEVQYEGGKTIKLPRLSTTGLGDYDRDKGYTQGAVTLAYDPYTMTQDRGTEFLLDAMDVLETNFVASATNVMKVFQAEQVIPEIDAYRYSKLAQTAANASNSEAYAPDATTILSKLREHIRAVTDYVGQVPLVISMTSEALAILESSKELTRTLETTQFNQGQINMNVKKIDDHVIRVVPAARMKDKYIFNDGTSKAGFEPDLAAKDVNWIVTPQNVPIAVSKTDKLRVFTPDDYQKANAWKIDYRKYHDLWVLKSKEKAVFACTKS